jgi:hypothetical protein
MSKRCSEIEMDGEMNNGRKVGFDVGDAPRDPEEAETAADPTLAEISAATTLGAVSLTAVDLERSLAYYEQAVSLKTLERDGRLRMLSSPPHAATEPAR